MSIPARRFRRELEVEIKAVTASFRPGELAYLAMTSKLELPMRDRLSWGLNGALDASEPGHAVAREWKRCDIAVLDLISRRPVAVIEAKAHITADAALDDGRYVKECFERDLLKARQKSAPYSPMFFAWIVVVHPVLPTPAPPWLADVVKYSSAVRRGIKQLGSAENVLDQAVINIRNVLEPFGRLTTEAHAAGEVFGVKVQVDTWLLGPV